MEHRVTCSECEAIARELAEAYAEAWGAADPQTRRAWEAVQKMLGGTEEDVTRAEELTKSLRYQPSLDYQASVNSYPDLVRLQSTAVFRATVKKVVHESRTRHKVPFRKPW